MSNRRFAQAVEWMRGEDPRLREKGFDFLREHADAYVDELIAEFEREQADDVRRLLLELLAEARSPRALPVLVGRLDGHDETLRLWAVRGLEMLDTREADRALDRARADGSII